MDPETLQTIRGSGTIACLRRVHALHAGLTPCASTPRRLCCQRHDLEHDVRRWWQQARIISGWDSAAFRPNNTCPVCEQRRSLRINLLLQSAVCVECREVWDSDTIGLLAEWIRAENHDTDLEGDDGAEDQTDTATARGA